MKKLGLLGVITPLLLIAGCAANQGQTVAHYMCSDNHSYTATYYQDTNKTDLMTLLLPDGQRVTMVNVVSADGAKYVGSIYEWWSKGDTATFSTMGSDALQCRQVDRK